MPAREELLIIIRGDGKSAQKVFQSVGQQAEQAGKKIDKNLAERLQKTGKTMTGVGKTLSIGLTAPLAAFGGVAVNAAMKSQRLTNTLEGLAGGAKGAEGYIEAIGEASLGTVSRVDALAAANRSLAFGIVKNKEEMGELTQIAITLGRAQGLTATQAVSDFATALSRSSPMILDNLGLQIKLTEAYKIYADALGKTADELTDVEKKEAFRQAALIKGRELVAQMGGLQDDAAASAERMKAKMSDLAVGVGGHLMPIMSQGVSVLGTVVGQFDKLSDSQKQLVIKLGFVAAAAGPAIGALGKLTGAVGKLIEVGPRAIDAIKNLPSLLQQLKNLGPGAAKGIGAATIALIALYKVQEEYQKQSKRVGGAAAEAESAIDSLGDSAVHLAKRFEDPDRAAVHLALRLQDLERATGGWRSGALLLGDLLTWNSNRAELLTDAFGEVQKAARDLSHDYESYLPVIDKYNSLQADARLKVQALSKEEYLHAQRLDLLVRAGVDYSKMQKEYTGQAEIIAAKTRTAGDAFRHLRADIIETGVEIKSLTKEQGIAAAQAWELGGGLMDMLAPALRTARHEFESSEMSVEEYEQRLREITANQRIIAEETEWATEIKERHDEIAEAAEESARRQKEAADEAARGQAGLISAMQGATEEMFRQQVLAQIDPAQTGVAAWAELGKELGLLTQTQVNLARATEEVSGAYLKGYIDVENMSEVTSDLFDASTRLGKADEDAGRAIKLLLNEYARAPGLIFSMVDPLHDYQDIATDLYRILPETADKTEEFHRSLEEIAKSTRNVTEKQEKHKKTLDYLNEKMRFIKGDMGDFATNVGKLEKPSRAAYELQEKHNKELKTLDEVLPDLRTRTDDYRTSVNDLQDITTEAHTQQATYNRKLDDLNKTQPRAKRGIDEFTQAHRNLRQPLRDSIQGVQDLKWELDQLPEQKTIDVIVRYVTIGVTSYVTPSGSPIEYQYGGRIPGRIGEPVLIMAHGGEEITNPYRRGARGGPGGPRPTNMPEYFGPFDISKVAQPVPTPVTSHGGDTVNYNIFNPLAAKMYSEMEYRRRRARFESGM